MTTERRLRRIHGQEEGAPPGWPPDEDPLAPARGCVVGVLLSTLILLVLAALAYAYWRAG